MPDLTSKIVILGQDIPVRPDTKLYAGYLALNSCDGKTYKEFRDLSGTRPQTPDPDNRPFSPSTIVRHAQEHGYARLVSEESINQSSDRRPIPTTTRDAILAAIHMFDRELSIESEWLDWANNKAHKFAIKENNRLYPVKKIVSIATNAPVSSFSGGWGSGNANQFVEHYGFSVVPLRSKNLNWTRDELVLALDLYLTHRNTIPSKESYQILNLSAVLKRLGQLNGNTVNDDYRNSNGVYLKLMNFRSLDPIYTSEGKVGMQRRGKADEQIWAEYSEDAGSCHKLAEQIRGFMNELEGAGPIDQGPAEDDDFTDASEGGAVARVHLSRERSSKLAKKRKANQIKELGHLECEVCGFDFGEKYGERGSRYIEAHHTIPVSELVAGAKTRLRDLALLCANCHRMIHAKRPWLTLDELRSLISIDD